MAFPYRKSSGRWSASTAYAVGNIVFWADNAWRALQVSTGVEPGTDPATWEAIGASSLWRFTDGDWQLFAIESLQQWVADNFQVALYASMTNDATGLGTIDDTWTPITGYSRDNFTSRQITTDLVNGTLSFTYPGVYRLGFFLSMQHDESNSGRETSVRLFQTTDGTAGREIPIGIGRNQPSTTFAIYPLFEIQATDVGKPWRVEIGNGDDIAVTSMTVDFEASMESEWKLAIPDPVQ